MNKLSKVLFFIAIVLCITLPLSAAKMMNVTVLSKKFVKEFQ